MMVLKDNDTYYFVRKVDLIRVDKLVLHVGFDITYVNVFIDNTDKLNDVLVYRIRGFIMDKIDSHEETTVEELRAEIKELIVSHGNN